MVQFQKNNTGCQFANWPPHREGKGRPKKEAVLSRSVGDRFNNQGNLHPRLGLGGLQMSRSLHPPARLLEVYIEGLTGFNHIFSPDGLDNT